MGLTIPKPGIHTPTPQILASYHHNGKRPLYLLTVDVLKPMFYNRVQTK